MASPEDRLVIRFKAKKKNNNKQTKKDETIKEKELNREREKNIWVLI